MIGSKVRVLAGFRNCPSGILGGLLRGHWERFWHCPKLGGGGVQNARGVASVHPPPNFGGYPCAPVLASVLSHLT